MLELREGLRTPFWLHFSYTKANILGFNEISVCGERRNLNLGSRNSYSDSCSCDWAFKELRIIPFQMK